MTKKLTIEEFIERANKIHGNKYNYSKVNYINSQTKICIICSKHKEFWQIPNNHIHKTNKRGCPQCAKEEQIKKQRYTKEEFIQRATEVHGNKYDYSKVVYIKNREKVQIYCKKCEEYFWQTPIHHINRHQGCPNEAKNKKLTKKEFIKKAIEIHKNKYDYSNVKYINIDTKVCIVCKEHGEFWQTPYYHINKESECLKCSNIKRANKQKNSIDKIKEIGLEKNLILLPEEYKKYKNVNTKLKWKCEICNHEFESTYAIVKVSNGCPKCSLSINEEIVRFYFEQIFNIKFIKVRPDWLRNEKGNKLELDGYCQDLKVAFEYQGLQHDEKIEFFGGEEKFKKQQKHDELKIKLCKENNIKLIIIPSLIFKLKLENLKDFIIEKCRKQNIELPENVENLEIDINNFEHSKSNRKIKEIQRLAISKSGKCLSKIYTGKDKKLLFECDKKHQWETIPKNIKNHWCPICWKINRKGKNHPQAKHYIFYSPCGVRHDVVGELVDFCKDNEFSDATIYNKLKKDIHTHKGWTFYKVEKIITNEKQ